MAPPAMQRMAVLVSPNFDVQASLEPRKSLIIECPVPLFQAFWAQGRALYFSPSHSAFVESILQTVTQANFDREARTPNSRDNE